MPKTHFIQIRVSRDQFERIRNNAGSKGYVTVSAYMRDLALEYGMITEKKIFEMHNLINEIFEKVKTIENAQRNNS